ncbi:MAG: 4Fe-4S binding protein [Thermoplasmata archaeon]|jgi:ferredoxin|nr:4Fe-4S binding protein [Thermoplasmata archaeon]
MAKRKIIEIDEDLCTGCGACVTSCAEGALQIVDGKAKVVNEVFCDGLGACIGECPTGALKIIEREAPEFDEKAVEEHLGHNKHAKKEPIGVEPCGCPSNNPMVLTASSGKEHHGRHGGAKAEELPPELTNWPVQWRLVSPSMPFFKGKDLLIAADCVPFAYRDFHGRFLEGKPVIIGCPKLDDAGGFLEKLTAIFKDATPKSITLAIMEVPCCGGLKKIVDEAVRRSGKTIPVSTTVVGIEGQILRSG